jgi:hypothetical protein
MAVAMRAALPQLGVRSERQVGVSEHKFKIGQWVSYAAPGERRTIYTVTQLLPPEGGGRRYRIKSVDEPHERVVRETEIRDA